MKLIFIIPILFISLKSFAQDCTPELLARKAGTWKAGLQGSIHGVNASDLVKEKSVLASINKMLITNYSPKGCQVLYSNAFSKYPGEGDIWKMCIRDRSVTLSNAEMNAYITKTQQAVMLILSPATKTKGAEIYQQVTSPKKSVANTAVGLWMDGKPTLALYLSLIHI